MISSLARVGLSAAFALSTALAAPDVYLRREGGALRFGNGAVELVLDAESGYFRSIRSKVTGVEHKPPDDGVWPFGLWAATREQPSKMKAEIRADGVQHMTWREEPSADGVKRLILTYPMLLDNATHQPSGVGLGLTIELAPDRGYLVLSAEIANGGGWWVTRYYAGEGKVLTGDASPESERIHIPTRGGFERAKFNGMSLGLPTYSWGWTDYSGRRGGIGMAYLNDTGIQLVFDVQPAEGGVIQSWRLFDTRGYWHFERSMNDYQKSLLIQPLEPANDFTTGEWLIVPHAGDWHATADVYRERYLKMFAGDYKRFENLPSTARELYVRMGFFIAENSIGNSYPRKVITPLNTVAPQIRKTLESIGLDPRHATVSLTFFHPHVGRYPEFFPAWEQAGGDQQLKAAIHDLRQMGVGSVSGYTHLSYDHPAAKNYVLEADALGTVPATNPTAGNRACTDNSAWIRLWRDELIPAYAARGFDSAYADEGHFPWGTCAVGRPAHLHGTTAVGILTANTRGALRLHRMLHDGLGPQSTIMVEGAGDVSGRWADLNHAYPDPAVAFTLPFKRYVWGLDTTTPDPKLAEHVNEALAHGYAIMCSGKSPADPAPLRSYLTFRRRLEQAHAPGYPAGFRDTVGLKWNSWALSACAFRDPKMGITVVYYATAPVETDLEIEGAALDMPRAGIQKRRVHLNTNEIDFLILQ